MAQAHTCSLLGSGSLASYSRTPLLQRPKSHTSRILFLKCTARIRSPQRFPRPSGGAGKGLAGGHEDVALWGRGKDSRSWRTAAILGSTAVRSTYGKVRQLCEPTVAWQMAETRRPRGIGCKGVLRTSFLSLSVSVHVECTVLRVHSHPLNGPDGRESKVVLCRLVGRRN